jgi:C-terminal processing protease CtpA/Prc
MAYQQIERMLAHLDDPYTRILPPRDFQNFRIGSDGEIQGVGLMIAQDPATLRLLVLTSLEGSPAARAGVKPGDEVVSINGTDTVGFGTDRAAALLRGKRGTNVTVRFARRSAQVPGIAGRPEQTPQIQIVKVMRRDRLEVNPVFSTTFAHAGQNGRQTTTGYIRLVNFNMHAADDVQKAIRQLRAQGASSYILDLRKNPGGLVRAGVDVARLFLDAPAPVFNVTGRAQPMQADVPGVAGGGVAPGPPPARIMQKVVLASSRALTKQPLALLVDGESASASEILAGALRDNGHRAVLIGDSNTYGKGKIQNVFELADGSALFVTVARYQTPARVDIDHVGIKPDLRCHALDAPPLRAQTRASLEELPPGLPMGLAMQLRTSESLEEDACVLTAEHVLDTLTASRAK